MRRFCRRAWAVLSAMWLSGFWCLGQPSAIPDLVNFQAIARDVNGALVIDQTIQVQITILEGITPSTELYRELHQPQTDAFGSFQIVLNQNPVITQGNFAAIPWETGNKWARIEYQTSLGGQLIELATLKLTSAFYAFASRTTEEVRNVQLTGASNGQILVFNAAAGEWEPQTVSLQLSGTSLSLSQGGTSVNIGPRIAVLKENKPNSSGGGAFIKDVWLKRALNTVEPSASPLVSLSNGEFTLGPGTYLIEAQTLAYYVGQHIIRIAQLDNTGNKTPLIYGTPSYSFNNGFQGAETTDAHLAGIITLGSPVNTLILEHLASSSNLDPTGLGVGITGFTADVPLCTVKITKLD